MRIDLPTGRGKGRSVPLTAERLINMYAEVAPPKSKSPAVVHGTPGFKLFTEIGSRNLIRGLYRTVADGALYAVVGTSLYSISSVGAVVDLGVIAGSGNVGIADNGIQLCIVSGAKGYIYDTTNGLSQIDDKDFPGANTVTYIDGFFVFNNRTPGQKDQFFISKLLDGKVYDALDFATAERYPDLLVRVFADHSELILFGEESIEIWFNAGNADFPFARAQGSVIEQGLGARWTVEKVDETVVWLDNEGMVRRLTGINPQRISTHAIENAISKGDWANATSWSYVEEGHQFYVLNVPKAQIGQTAGTYVWDAATGLWHERQSYELDSCRLGFYARAYNKHIVGDLFNGKLYEMSLDTYDEDGNPLIAELQFPQVQNDGDRFMVDQLQLDMEVGAPEPAVTFTPDIPAAPYTGTIYAMIDGNSFPAEELQLYKSTDQGTTWARTGVRPPNAGDPLTESVGGLAFNSSLVLFCNTYRTEQYNDWYWTSDEGATWNKVSGDGVTAPDSWDSGFANTYYTMNTPSVIDNKFYVLDNAYFVWRTEDCVTWEKLGQLPGSSLSAAGRSWFPTSQIIKIGTTLYAIGKDADDAITPGSHAAGIRAIYASTDDGATWTGHYTDYTNKWWGGQSNVIQTETFMIGAPSTEVIDGVGGASINEIRKSSDLLSFSNIAATGQVNDGSPDIPSDRDWPQVLATNNDGSLIGMIDQDAPYGAVRYSTDQGATWQVGPEVTSNPWGNNPPLAIWWIGTAFLVKADFDGIDRYPTYLTDDFINYTEVLDNPFGDTYGGSYRIARGDYTGTAAIPGTPGKSFGEPMVMLDVSGNTRTFDMTQQWRSMGQTGEYDKRVIWRRLGQHRSFTPRFRISSPVKRAVFTAYAKIRPTR